MRIVTAPSQTLKTKCRPVKEEEFGQPLHDHMSMMMTAMFRQQGVGIAGPQVADERRIIVVRTHGTTHLMCNPEIIGTSEEKTSMEEGCLSLPGFSLEVERPRIVEVRWRTPHNDEVVTTFSDYEAHIVQHEIEHLDGITLLDKASQLVRSRYQEKVRKARKKMARTFSKVMAEWKKNQKNPK